MLMGVLPVCISVHFCVPGTWGGQKRTQLPRTPARGGYELPWPCWQLQPRPLQKQQVLAATPLPCLSDNQLHVTHSTSTCWSCCYCALRALTWITACEGRKMDNSMWRKEDVPKHLTHCTQEYFMQPRCTGIQIKQLLMMNHKETLWLVYS